MLGLCAMLLVFFTLIGALSYWVSWELLDKRDRPAFSKKLLDDCAGLVGRHGVAERQAVAAERP